jgi:hypothetical protein
MSTTPRPPAEDHTTTEGSHMSSTITPARTGRVSTRAAVSTVLAASAAAAVGLVAFTGVADGSPARPAPAPDGREMPTPEWLQGYLEPQVAGDGSDRPAPPQPTRPVNRGLR